MTKLELTAKKYMEKNILYADKLTGIILYDTTVKKIMILDENTNTWINAQAEDERDLANVEDYNEFLKTLVDDFFMQSARVLKPKGYMCLVVSDFRHKSEFISFHSDLIQAMNHKLTDDGYQMSLQGVKILIQNHKSLLPYGYPFAYVENIHHQYILIFRKMESKEV